MKTPFEVVTTSRGVSHEYDPSGRTVTLRTDAWTRTVPRGPLRPGRDALRAEVAYGVLQLRPGSQIRADVGHGLEVRVAHDVESTHQAVRSFHLYQGGPKCERHPSSAPAIGWKCAHQALQVELRLRPMGNSCAWKGPHAALHMCYVWIDFFTTTGHSCSSNSPHWVCIRFNTPESPIPP